MAGTVGLMSCGHPDWDYAAVLQLIAVGYETRMAMITQHASQLQASESGDQILPGTSSCNTMSMNVRMNSAPSSAVR